MYCNIEYSLISIKCVSVCDYVFLLVPIVCIINVSETWQKASYYDCCCPTWLLFTSLSIILFYLSWQKDYAQNVSHSYLAGCIPIANYMSLKQRCSKLVIWMMHKQMSSCETRECFESHIAWELASSVQKQKLLAYICLCTLVRVCVPLTLHHIKPSLNPN